MSGLDLNLVEISISISSKIELVSSISGMIFVRNYPLKRMRFLVKVNSCQPHFVNFKGAGVSKCSLLGVPCSNGVE